MNLLKPISYFYCLDKIVKYLRKISAILLSLLVLLSSTSFTFNMHFCMGEMKSIALFSSASPCQKKNQRPPCPRGIHDQDGSSHSQMTKKGCCEDQSLVKDGLEELTQTSSVSVPDVPMMAALYATFSLLSDSPFVHSGSYNEYSPPLIERDIPVFIQSFLI